MAQGIEYWNGIPTVRAQPVLSDLQRWQAQRRTQDQTRDPSTWTGAGPQPAAQRAGSAGPEPRSPV